MAVEPRRRFTGALLLVVALTVGGCAGTTWAVSTLSPGQRVERVRAVLAPGLDDTPPVLVIAHRGCWQTTSENSIAAIEACVAGGIDIVELDVRRTADGVLILMHDETVDRMTNGRGRVEDLTLAEIQAMRLRRGKGGKDAALTSESPPTFEAAMRATRGRVFVNLDAKADVYDDAFSVLEQVGATDEIIMKRRVAVGEPSLAAQSPFSRVIAMPIVSDLSGTARDLLKTQTDPAPPAVEVLFTDRTYLSEASGLIRRSGGRVWVNTLRPEISAGLTDAAALQAPDAVWGWLLENGVTMIQTDEPETLVRYLERRGRRQGL